MLVESRAALALNLLRLRLHDWHYPLRPIARGQRRVGVREDLGADAIGMLERIAQGKRGTEGLAADKPAINAEELADYFELCDVRVWRIGGGIVRGRRSCVAEQLDHNRTEFGGERLEVEEPVGAAGQEAVDEEEVWPGLPIYFEVEERLASSQS